MTDETTTIEQLGEEMDRAAMALLKNLFPVNSDSAGAESPKQPDPQDQVRILNAVREWYETRTKGAPPAKQAGKGEHLRNRLHGSPRNRNSGDRATADADAHQADAG